jgi:hypothetical protein
MKYTLEQWVFLVQYVCEKINHVKEGFTISILVLSPSFINDFQICEESAFNLVFPKQGIH